MTIRGPFVASDVAPHADAALTRDEGGPWIGHQNVTQAYRKLPLSNPRLAKKQSTHP
jgi:hypothetical protein